MEADLLRSWVAPLFARGTHRSTRVGVEHELIAGGVSRALAIGVVDEVIEPSQTRRRLAEALASAPARRGRHGNIPL